MTDQEKIKIANKLFREKLVTLQEFKQFKTKNGKVWDDTNFIADICDNGDVYIHNRGTYPLILKGYGMEYISK